MIKKILLKFLSNEVNAIKTKAFNDGKNLAKSEERINRANFAHIEAEMFIGKPVIILVNEWKNPVIGELVAAHFKDENTISPLYEVHNYLTNEKTFSLQKPFAFSMQKMIALDKLSPDEACSLFHEGKDRFYTYRKHQTYGKPMSELTCFFTGFNDWMEKLSENGFFTKFASFLDEEENKASENWAETLNYFSNIPKVTDVVDSE